MEDAEQDQKTEDPSAKRLTEARDEGNVSVSRELSSWFMLIGILIVLAWTAPSLANQMRIAFRVFLEKPEQISIEGGGLQDAFLGIAEVTVFPAILTFGILWIMSILGTMIQTGFFVNTASLKLDIMKLSPMRGLKKLFSMNSISELVKSFFKLVVLGYLTYVVLKPVFDKVPQLPTFGLADSLVFLEDNAVHLLTILMILISVIAVADVLYTRYQYFKNLRMTKQEVKDEYKQTEGDPMIKSRLRSIRIEKARRRMMSKVPDANVVITNPTHYAVALHYDGTKMAAPVLVAKGADRIALRIREVAEENEVPIVSNPPLARALFDTVDFDQPITPEHYRAVAEVISYVYKLKNKR
ncbi:MAG: flagellar biosynthesis protein FlhB [Alphaproteobacteria bacterium]|nr:flagellar biosynthesis protein FlhB [Alphaproteobacteria bacterium]